MIAIELHAVRRLLDEIANNVTRFDCQFCIEVAWPQTVAHEGKRFFKTGKEGNRRSDGMPSAEYQTEKDRRLWLDVDGVVRED